MVSAYGGVWRTSPSVDLPRDVALEIRPDGSFARWGAPSGGAENVQATSLADGRVVTLLWRQPARLTAAFSASGGVRPSEQALTLFAADGTVERRATAAAGNALLVGATAEAAYLWDAGGLVAYELATGSKRVLGGVDQLGFGRHWQAGIGRVYVLDEWTVVTWPGTEQCQYVLTRRSTGAVEKHQLGGGACDVLSARFSPDRRLAGFSYLRSGSGPLRVAVVEIATGALLADEAFPAPGDTIPSLGPARPVGMAWQDPNRLRVALAAPPDRERVYSVEEAVQVRTIDVGRVR